MAYPRKSKYSLLNSSAPAISNIRYLPHSIGSVSRCPKSSSSAVSSLSTLLPVGMSRVNPSTAHQLQPCGNDDATARANGCIFDLLTLAWLAPECYDADLSAESLEDASETFYYDEDAQRPIESYDVLSERPLGEYSWTTRKYHIYIVRMGGD